MKKLKKFIVALCITVLAMTTTVFAETAANYDENSIKESVKALVEQIVSMDEKSLEYWKDNSIGWQKEAFEGMLTYVEDDQLGDYKSVEDPEINEKKDVIEVETVAHFSKNDLKVKFNMIYVSGSIVPDSIEYKLAGEETKPFGERIADAALNTVIGLATVVVILLLISFIISLFRFIPKLQEMFSKKNEASADAALENAIAQIEENEENADDTELVAVITAAICASTGASSDSFVVRSIKKANRKKTRI